MIHKFVANDNKGNVNILEVTSTGTKLGKVAPPVEDTDVATKKYVDDNTGTGAQEYWIPLEYSGGTLRIPEGKVEEVNIALHNPNRYWVRGVNLGYDYYAGYVENTFEFIVPLTKCFMMDRGYDCAGKIRIANNSGVYEVTTEPDKFIVTLTPTAQDYSGTMDKTVAEINAAYEAGQEIWFKVMTSATSYVEVPVSFLGKSTSFDYPNFGAEIVQSVADLMIVAETFDTSDGTKATYSTTVYSLTPAS